ncbi:uncharacterized protein IL334_002894 [Kwoniella shivajii]|uniref:Uncharacterized protein n=1 Tax=Kwoniella shivajii TaxID=564305 RepID=A0ABZ1CW10_9TREE|nr:hypothetical protein IL334_002894 [Kwoniella shivajii]
MGFNTPDHDTMAKLRDEAETNHKAYWAENGNGYEPTGQFFPGFESGWADACSALSSGNELPGDLEQWGKQRAQENGKDVDQDWEWVHGFKSGAGAAQQAGSN